MKDKLEEGIDYIFNEDGLMEFTREYHLKRGVCCGNKCRNCPFDWVNVNHSDGQESQ